MGYSWYSWTFTWWLIGINGYDWDFGYYIWIGWDTLEISIVLLVYQGVVIDHYFGGMVVAAINYWTEVEEYESTAVYCTLLFHNSCFLRTLGKKLTLDFLLTFLSFYNSCLCSIVVFLFFLIFLISHIYQFCPNCVCSKMACSIMKFAIIPFYNSGFYLYTFFRGPRKIHYHKLI